MSIPSYIQKTLVMKPEVSKIFDDLEDWLNYCRFNLINFDPKDLYRSSEYKEFQKEKQKLERQAKKENRNKTEH